MLYYTFHRMSSCFTAGGKRRGGKMGKSMGKTWKKRRTKGRKRRKKYEWQLGSKKKRQKITWATRNQRKKNCNMQSWERAQPLSPFEVSPDGTGRRFCLENSGWRDPLGYHNAAKYPPADFFIDLVLCVVGRFACQVPNLSATRTAIPERFFGRKITAGNFMSRKPKA